jgi:glycosyltransferase involved in cell wall biosynthesis
MEPAVSIIIPVYNRAKFIARALESCLSQTCDNFEVVVVDDGSTDDSVDVISRYVGPRVRLVRQPENHGVGPARNLAADNARGDWLVLLDSDDELVSNAIETVISKISSLGSGVDSLLFCCQMDDGSRSPTTIPKFGRYNYEEYLSFIDGCSGAMRDSLMCMTRRTFSSVRFPDNYGLEDLYHLDFNKEFVTEIHPEILRLYHQDAGNQLVKRVTAFDRGRDAVFARDRAEILEEALRRHGKALRRHAPLLFREFLSRLLVLNLLCGRRLRAIRTMWRAFIAGVAKPSHVVILLLGLWHPSMIAWARASKLRSIVPAVRTRFKSALPGRSL